MPLSLASWRLRGVLVALVCGAAASALWRVSQQPPWPQAFRWPAASALAAPAAAAEPASAPVARFASSRPGEAVHAASMVLLANGHLRAAWFSGSREGAADVEIRTATFDPASGRWSDEATALSREQVMQGLVRRVKKLGNPVLARAPGGGLHLYVVTVALGGWAGSSITRFESSDEGASWQRPVKLVTSPFLNISTLVKGTPVAYADGTVGLPVYHELVRKEPQWLWLDADGRVLDRVRMPQGHGSLQPVVLPRSETQADLLMRTMADERVAAAHGDAARITQSLTTQAGRAWAAVAANELPNPNAAVAALVTRRGDRLLVFNDSAVDRGNLTLAWADAPAPGSALRWQRLALLEGRSTRPEGARLDTSAHRAELQAAALAVRGSARRGTDSAPALAEAAARQLCYPTSEGKRCNLEYSYPSLAEDAAGNVHLLYTWHRAAIKHLVLPRAWIDAQRAVAGAAAPAPRAAGGLPP